MGLKIDIIVEYVIAKNKDYKIIPPHIIKEHIKKKFNCSTYQSNQVIKKLNEK